MLFLFTTVISLLSLWVFGTLYRTLSAILKKNDLKLDGQTKVGAIAENSSGVYPVKIMSNIAKGLLYPVESVPES